MNYPYHIADIPKNGREVIRVQVVNFSGFIMLDIRTFAKGKNQSEHVATPKGATFHLKDYGVLLDALKKHEANIENLSKP